MTSPVLKQLQKEVVTSVVTSIISDKEYNDLEEINEKVGSLLFANEYYDCLRYVDTKKLRKELNMKGRGRIVKILVKTKSHPEFVNKMNKTIMYKSPMYCGEHDDGATPYKSKLLSGFVQKHPMGDAVIVVKDKKIKTKTN